MKYPELKLKLREPTTPPLPAEPCKEVQDENKLRKIVEAEIKGTVWEVICVVSRHKGEDEKKARAAYQDFIAKSDMGYGRVGHENVILLLDGQVIAEHKWAGPRK